jgi:SAM-dependent methyltransferase
VQKRLSLVFRIDQKKMDSNVDEDMLNGEDRWKDIEICTNCLFCGGIYEDDAIRNVKDEFFKADDGIFDFHRCSNCGSLWLHNRPSGQRLLKAYDNYYTHDDEPDASAGIGRLRGWVRAAYFRGRFASAAKPVDRLVASAISVVGWDTSALDKGMRFVPSPPAKILDYGCGSGIYLLRLRTLGYELHGVEYDPQLLDRLADAGISIHDVATLGADHWDKEFDHITIAHVLEHVPDPQALLGRLFRWLKPGGSLYVELPNADATGLAIFGRYWRGLEAPRHFALPNRAALVDAFGRAGFSLDHQHIDRSTRRWVWDESLHAAPPDERPALIALMSSASPENESNAEFLTFLVRKPA